MKPDDPIRQRIDQAAARRERQRAVRVAFAEARTRGVAARHAAKAGNPPARVTHCPACRHERIARRVGAGHVDGRPVILWRCPRATCRLLWAIPDNTTPLPHRDPQTPTPA